MNLYGARWYLFGATALAVACAGGEEAATDGEAGDVQVASAETSSQDAVGCYLHRGTREEAASRPSPLTEVGLAFSGGTGLICYGAPSANDRAVMGALVPFGEPWRAGANEPTTVHLTAAASIGGVALEPGSYSIYAIPGEEEWQFFVNSNYERWGIPISDEVRSTEVGSFTATPETVDDMAEQLTFSYSPNGENTMGDIVLAWENTRVSFHLHPGSM